MSRLASRLALKVKNSNLQLVTNLNCILFVLIRKFVFCDALD